MTIDDLMQHVKKSNLPPQYHPCGIRSIWCHERNGRETHSLVVVEENSMGVQFSSTYDATLEEIKSQFDAWRVDMPDMAALNLDVAAPIISELPQGVMSEISS